MEVPRRPQPTSFTLALPNPTTSALASLGVVEKTDRKDQVKEKFQVKCEGATEEDSPGEETLSTEEESFVFTITEAPEHEDSNASNVEVHPRVSSQGSFSEESSVSEERLLQEAEEAKKKSEEEEMAAKERAAQKQLLAIEELVQSERNYLRMLQVITVTIRSNLWKLQVCM